MKLPPNPVSMSAISGGPLPGARFAIMSAFDFMSYSWARARSGCPRREAVVPAPVYNDISVECKSEGETAVTM